MSGAWHGGKGDRIPGANDAAYQANYPAIDWNAREREAAIIDIRAAHLKNLRRGQSDGIDWNAIVSKDKP